MQNSHLCRVVFQCPFVPVLYTIGWDLVLFRVKEDEEQINVAVYANPRKRAELICCCTYKFKMILYRKQFCKIICFRKDIRQERVQYPWSPMLTPSKLLYFWKKLMIKITKHSILYTVYSMMLFENCVSTKSLTMLTRCRRSCWLCGHSVSVVIDYTDTMPAL